MHSVDLIAGEGGRRYDFVPRRLRLLFAKNRRLTPLRVFNYLLVHLEMRIGRTRLYSYPYELCIDVSNKCNLHCPYCPTGRGDPTGRGRGNISLDLFKSVIDDLAPRAYQLELFNWGEAFFNPELPRLIEHAHRRGLVTLISSNLSFRLHEEFIRSVIESGLTYLTASVDGADQQSYEIYRRGGKFDLVMENLRTFVRLKRELKSEFPIICWQYLIFAHNEDRLEDAKRLAQDLGIGFTAYGGLYDDPSWAPKNEYSTPYLAIHPNRCVFLWKKAVFHWDGGMASCCQGFYKHDDFAHWEPGTFGKMWNNDKFIAARRIWTEQQSPLPQGHFCTECDKVRLYRGLPLRSKMKPAVELTKRAVL